MKCRHVWAIEMLTPGKSTVEGKCKRCKEERSFPAHVSEEWGPLTMNNRMKRQKPKAWKGTL